MAHEPDCTSAKHQKVTLNLLARENIIKQLLVGGGGGVLDATVGVWFRDTIIHVSGSMLQCECRT